MTDTQFGILLVVLVFGLGAIAQELRQILAQLKGINFRLGNAPD
jgi:hypothetical protein